MWAREAIVRARWDDAGDERGHPLTLCAESRAPPLALHNCVEAAAPRKMQAISNEMKVAGDPCGVWIDTTGP
jgi:hypothetical protein